MRDEMDMRLWEAQHADFSAFLADAIDKARLSFERRSTSVTLVT